MSLWRLKHDYSYLCDAIKEFFLSRRNAKPLYSYWLSSGKEDQTIRVDKYFSHEGAYWVYNYTEQDLYKVRLNVLQSKKISLS